MLEDRGDTTSYYHTGKLPQADLLRFLANCSLSDPQIILGPGLGHDAAVIDLGERYLATKSDPITFATDEIGWYVVHVNANDIACVGAIPRWFIATLLLPAEKTTPTLAEKVFAQLCAACEEVGVTLIGGHTEITHGLDRPIAVGTMLGEIEPGRLIRSDGARPGDRLLLTKGIAIEGCAILARELTTRLYSQVPEDVLSRAAGFLHDPGISVLREARILASLGGVHAMHDPTEGGVATGILELVQSAGCGAHIERAALPILPETALLCDCLDLDPLGLISSGALLAAVAPNALAPALEALRAAGIPATEIGCVTEAPGVFLHAGDSLTAMPQFARDELAHLFD